MRHTKQSLKVALGLTMDSEIAGLFGISQSAVCQWKDDEPIPELRQLQAERVLARRDQERDDLPGANADPPLAECNQSNEGPHGDAACREARARA